MATKEANIYVRVKPDVKAQAEQIYSSFGLNLSDAINIFLSKSIMVGGLPFDMRLTPNAETLEAIREVERMKQDPALGKSYTDVDLMMKELLV